MCVRVLPAIAAAMVLSSCAIHPVPEDVTGVTTFQIVKQIRCETREAAAQLVLKELRRLGTDHPDQAAEPIAKALVEKYDADPDLISTFTPDVFPATPRYAQVRNLYRVIYSAGIAYNFDLTMNEQNNLGTSMDLLGPWARQLTLGLSADANRTRSNERTFTVTDNFNELLTKLNTPVRGQRYCDGQLAQANYVYPIAGRIGVDELVKTFFELSLFGDLSVADATPGKIGAPAIADKLTFTTTLDGSANPKVTFSPVGAGFQFTDASISGMVQRMDTHQVTVGLALDAGAVASLGSLRGYLFSRTRGAGVPVASASTSKVVQLTTVTAQVRTRAEAVAVGAIDQLKSREIQLVRAR